MLSQQHQRAPILSSSSTASAGTLMLVAAIFSDRKSTRLNSSHSQISYAVFCLKKKNNPVPLNPSSDRGSTPQDAADLSGCELQMPDMSAAHGNVHRATPSVADHPRQKGRDRT